MSIKGRAKRTYKRDWRGRFAKGGSSKRSAAQKRRRSNARIDAVSGFVQQEIPRLAIARMMGAGSSALLGEVVGSAARAKYKGKKHGVRKDARKIGARIKRHKIPFNRKINRQLTKHQLMYPTIAGTAIGLGAHRVIAGKHRAAYDWDKMLKSQRIKR